MKYSCSCCRLWIASVNWPGWASPACCKYVFAPTEKLQKWHKPAAWKVSPQEAAKSFATPAKVAKLKESIYMSVNYDALAGLSFAPIFSTVSRDCVALVDSVTYDRSMSLPAFPHDTTSNIDKFSFEHLKDRDFFMQLSICTYILRKLYEHWESTLLQGHISRPTTSKYDVTHYCQDISVPTEEFLDSLIPPQTSHMFWCNGEYVFENTGLHVHLIFAFPQMDFSINLVDQWF